MKRTSVNRNTRFLSTASDRTIRLAMNAAQADGVKAREKGRPREVPREHGFHAAWWLVGYDCGLGDNDT